MDGLTETSGKIVKAIWTAMPFIAENHPTWEQEMLQVLDYGDYYALYFVKPMPSARFIVRGGGMFTVEVEKETYKIIKTYYAR